MSTEINNKIIGGGVLIVIGIIAVLSVQERLSELEQVSQSVREFLGVQGEYETLSLIRYGGIILWGVGVIALFLGFIDTSKQTPQYPPPPYQQSQYPPQAIQQPQYNQQQYPLPAQPYQQPPPAIQQPQYQQQPYQQPITNIPPSAPMKQCQNCSKQIPYNDDFCPSCGNKQP